MSQNEIFITINALPILDVLSAYGISCQKVSGSQSQYFVLKPDGKIDSSFSVHTEKNIATNFGGNGESGKPFDVIGKLLGVDPKDKVGTGMAVTLKWFKDKGLVVDTDVRKPFVKSLKDKEILKKFESLKMGGYNDAISKWLLKRGVSYDVIFKNHLLLGEVFKDFGIYDNYFCTEHEGKVSGDSAKSVQVILFPCYHIDDKLNKILVGLKLRRVDGKTIRGKKSHAIGHTGLMWDYLGDKTSFIVEGECDYVIMKLLGFKSVISNNGGVLSHREKIKNICYDIDKVVCLYDNDEAGIKGKAKLSEEMNRQIFTVDMPIRNDSKGNALSDINDYYVAGYNLKSKWNSIFKDLVPVGIDIIGEAQKKTLYRFLYLSAPIMYYDREENKGVGKEDISTHTGYNSAKIFEMRQTGKIEEYRDVCYQYGGREGYFNSMNTENMILDPDGEDPIIPEGISVLINNFCGYNPQNIEWMHRAILYKMTHINDCRVPAVISHGEGGSGKGTLIKLLGKIFGAQNTQQGLGQKDLVSSFDSYTGGKIILEFREISSGNTQTDKIVLDRLKGIIFEERIHINPKFQPAREVDNIAWVHMSSNHGTPLQLDSASDGNRRFTVIETGGPLTDRQSEIIHSDIEDTKKVKQYISWLLESYPDVPSLRVLHALDNADKRSLVDNCEEIGVLFFQWFESEFPEVYKITGPEFKILLAFYRRVITGESDANDRRYDIGNIKKGLNHIYKYSRIKIRGKSIWGYYIKKTEFQKKIIPLKSDGSFSPQEWNEFLRKDGVHF